MTPSARHRLPVRKAAPNLLALGILCALAPCAFAQSANGDAADLDAVTVTGIRGSLQSSMNLKRDSVGVIDGIIAEDIGKFPDTNLAESLQRISGVSIDRTDSGEGSKVTVRGVGPDFNLVLLNGRQMPNTIFNSRAFDFANLASEAVSELQVFKTVHADIPTGGIGATINIKTARPLDNPGFRATASAKGVMDTSVDNLPRSFRGKSVTPEVSGIYSQTFADDRFGVAANFSYQERDSGYSQAAVTGGWLVFRGDENEIFSRIPAPDHPDYVLYDIKNHPHPTDIYARPQDYNLSVNAARRQRRNGQIALQFAPVDNVTATLDYTYAENRTQRQRAELSIWYNYAPGEISFTDGPVAAPIIYSEYIPLGNQDHAMAGTEEDFRNELKSLGFNVEWQVNDRLDLALDVHDSRAEMRPDNPFGSRRSLGAAAWVRGTTQVDFSSAFPIMNVELAPGVSAVGPEHMVATGSGFSSTFNHSEVQQWQARGTFRFADYQALNFGLAYADVYNRSARANMSVNSWGGAWRPDLSTSTPDEYDDSIWYADHMGKYFKQFSGYNDPRFTDRFMIFDFDRLHKRIIEVTGRPDWYTAPKTFTTDRRTTEQTQSAWLQWSNTFDWAVPVNVAAGVRYENTETTSPALVLPPATNVMWLSLNEMVIDFDTVPVSTSNSGKYHYWLPSLDVRADLRENLILRGSYGKSIGRAAWEQLYGGLGIGVFSRVQGGTGSRGVPGLLPLEAKNVDLSLEWYYGEGSYVSLGYFRKDIRNFISNTIVRERPYDVHTPIGGEFWNEALSVGGCPESDLACIRDYIFLNHGDDPSVNHTGQNAGGQQTGTITGRESDPVMTYDITVPANQRSDKLDGLELSVQHMFGQSGFGVSANYTKVDSGLIYDDTRLGDQSPMVGLSDSANLVLFYENSQWQVRAAYNWRDKFLSGISGAGSVLGTNPNYTESFGQLDMNVTWEQNAHLAFFVEGINLTNETMRTHGRHTNMLVSAIQTGPRYMFGVRYKF